MSVAINCVHLIQVAAQSWLCGGGGDGGGQSVSAERDKSAPTGPSCCTSMHGVPISDDALHLFCTKVCAVQGEMCGMIQVPV